MESRKKWVGGTWRRTPVADRPVAWIIQETHVSTEAEASQLEEDWARAWGKHLNQTAPKLSYWSINEQRTGGVGILLNPRVADSAAAWHPELWSNRVLAVQVGGMVLVDIYAPNDKADRERFYTELQHWPWAGQQIVIAGDFNSVQSPMLDRLGGNRSVRPESMALQTLTQHLQLEDARILEEPAEGEAEAVEPTEYFTYWGPESASRLDRFYVPISWTDRVQWVSVEEPNVQSDHQRVQLHYRDKSSSQKAKRRRRVVKYPVKAAQPERIQQTLLQELAEVGVGKDTKARKWENMTQMGVECIRRVTEREKQRKHEVIKRLRAQNRAHLITRNELIKENISDMQEEYLVREGQRLERTREQMKWRFKRISTWEQDQTITTIQHIHGEPFERETPIANRFGSEWKSVLGVIHNHYKLESLEEEFDEFVKIPDNRRVSQKQNESLMGEITSDEVIQAIDALNRNKAAGADGLNNDFSKDAQALLVPVVVAIGNELLKGGEPPPSILEGLIIALRKKGDSSDAMDFRPISLLQTGYKVYTKVIATRTQRVLGTPIGDSQQGFVHGRQMLKTVMMMLAILANATDEPELEADLSRVILLLNFRKAYDTVTREFLFLALIKFGFSEEFVNMVRRLHEGTTARFLVNGELSDPQEVISGIRQGCPLAPLLFILAAEVLALAIRQDKEVVGIQVPGGNGERHSFSAFVDDSTVFMQEAKQLPKVMSIVKQFGRLSGLQVQPTKSHVLFLNKSVKVTAYHGIPVVRHGDTVRYLGYAVGTGELTNVNWAGRIRAVQRRLATATQIATSVENRVTILNVMLLPSVLFTAAAFDMPKWAEDQIRNIQKQFLWKRSTSTEATRHKMNPGLIFAPREAGGVGVASVFLACKTQRMKHMMQWLIQRKDVYFKAWKAWMFREATSPWKEGISPRKTKSTRAGAMHATPGDKLQQLIGEWLQPSRERSAEEILSYRDDMEELSQAAVSGLVQGEWLIELPRELPPVHLSMTREDLEFWPTYQWNDNPWIVDREGRMLTTKKYEKIRACTLGQLNITREAATAYSFTIPVEGEKEHQQAKLRRWAIAILMNAPRLEIGKKLEISPQLRLRRPMQLTKEYKWEVLGPGRALGTQEEERGGGVHTIVVEQQPNGVHWRVSEMAEQDSVTEEDRKKMQKRQMEGSIVFYAHPDIHGFPWRVKDSIANKHILKVLKKQPYDKYKGEGRVLHKLINGLQEISSRSNWQRAVMMQMPKQVWAHGHELTEYQVWVAYRIAVRQLNLYYEGKEADNRCRKLEKCKGIKETMEHIFWECQCAQACWRKLIEQWTGEICKPEDIWRFQQNCASREAPKMSPKKEEQVRALAPDEEKETKQVWKRIWRILAAYASQHCGYNGIE